MSGVVQTELVPHGLREGMGAERQEPDGPLSSSHVEVRARLEKHGLLAVDIDACRPVDFNGEAHYGVG
jgi:hypothetical protein